MKIKMIVRKEEFQKEEKFSSVGTLYRGPRRSELLIK
jgi:hypothetical protein